MFFVVMTIVMLVVASTTYFFFRSPGTTDFRLHRARYELMIAKIKTMGLTPGTSAYFWTNSNFEPDSLTRHRPHSDSNMMGMIHAMRIESGQYQVSIVTRDEGHSGTFGYVYSDALTGLPSATGGLPSLQRQVDPHWWIAYNNTW